MTRMNSSWVTLPDNKNRGNIAHSGMRRAVSFDITFLIIRMQGK